MNTLRDCTLTIVSAVPRSLPGGCGNLSCWSYRYIGLNNMFPGVQVGQNSADGFGIKPSSPKTIGNQPFMRGVYLQLPSLQNPSIAKNILRTCSSSSTRRALSTFRSSRGRTVTRIAIQIVSNKKNKETNIHAHSQNIISQFYKNCKKSVARSPSPRSRTGLLS
jgi:hypothetical protein